MSVSISPQIKVLALVGVLMIALAGGYKYVYLRHANEPIVIPPAVHTKPAPAAGKPGAKTKTQTGSHEGSASASTNSAAAAAAKHASAQIHLNPVNPLLPSPLRWALAKHKVVVVSLWDPQAPVDQISVAEAHAGATAANVGFVVVNVLDNKVAGPLTALLPQGEMLPDPGVLIYRAPGKRVYRFDGFLDRDSVAQAAHNAKDGLDTAPAAEATVP